MLDGVYHRRDYVLLPHTSEVVFTDEQSTGKRYDTEAGARNAGCAFDEDGHPVTWVAWVVGVEEHEDRCSRKSGCLIRVLCPLCDCVHFHGNPYSDGQPGHRSSRCSKPRRMREEEVRCAPSLMEFDPGTQMPHAIIDTGSCYAAAA